MNQPRLPVLYQMAKVADVVVERTAPARCTLLLAALLMISILINIILGCLYGDAVCAVDGVIESKDINMDPPENLTHPLERGLGDRR